MVDFSVVSFTQCSPNCGCMPEPDAFARSVTVARSSAVQASSIRQQERRWAIVWAIESSGMTVRMKLFRDFNLLAGVSVSAWCCIPQCVRLIAGDWCLHVVD